MPETEGGAGEGLPASEGQAGSEFAERLEFARQVLGCSIPEIATRMGTSVSTWHRWRRGSGSPGAAELLVLAGAGLDLNWLITGEGAPWPTQAGAKPSPEWKPRVREMRRVEADDFAFLPRYEVAASAGGGAVIHSEQIVDYLAFKKDWIRRVVGRGPTDLILVEATGDSMEPTIGDGELLLVDTASPKVKDHAVHVLNVDGELLVKRIARNLATGGLTVISDNARYPKQEVTPEQFMQLRLVGRVIWHGGVL